MGTGIKTEKMAPRRWLSPLIVVAIDFLECALDDACVTGVLPG